VITGSGTLAPTAKQAGVQASLNFFRLPLSQRYPWTLTVLVDELDAEVVENFIKPFSSCSCGDSVGRHEEMAGIFQFALIFWIISKASGRRRAKTSDAREREPRISASSA